MRIEVGPKDLEKNVVTVVMRGSSDKNNYKLDDNLKNIVEKEFQTHYDGL